MERTAGKNWKVELRNEESTPPSPNPNADCLFRRNALYLAKNRPKRKGEVDVHGLPLRSFRDWETERVASSTRSKLRNCTCGMSSV